jgi:hypothetical protein
MLGLQGVKNVPTVPTAAQADQQQAVEEAPERDVLAGKLSQLRLTMPHHLYHSKQRSC